MNDEKHDDQPDADHLERPRPDAAVRVLQKRALIEHEDIVEVTEARAKGPEVAHAAQRRDQRHIVTEDDPKGSHEIDERGLSELFESERAGPGGPVAFVEG